MRNEMDKKDFGLEEAGENGERKKMRYIPR